LDSYDLRILEVLQRNGRITNQKLAEEVCLSSSACYERVRRLEKTGYILSYKATVQVERLICVFLMVVVVTLKSHRATDFRQFEEAIQNVPEIIDCYETGGGVDYVLNVMTIDIQHYQDVIETLLSRGIGIERYFSYVVTKKVKAGREIPIRHLLGKASERDM